MLQNWFKYLIKKSFIIIAFSIVGVAIGLGYYLYSKPTFRAECTFILYENNNDMSSSASALALLGMGQSGNAASLFNSSNLIWFYTSKLMIEQTLLTPIKRDGKEEPLINWFLEVSKLKDEFNNDKLLKNVTFDSKTIPGQLTNQQNIILGACISKLKSGILKVTEEPKTENVITVSIETSDEVFSKIFVEQIVKNVNDYYIENTTQKSREEVEGLQEKINNLSANLGKTMLETANEVDAVPNANPLKQVLRVQPQRRSIDVQANSAMYVELMKNLETAKLSMLRQTPIIQVIDYPFLPLPNLKWSLFKCLFLGGSIFFLIGTLLVIIHKSYYNLMKN